MASFLSLPTEVLSHIFKYLSIEELLKLWTLNDMKLNQIILVIAPIFKLTPYIKPGEWFFDGTILRVEIHKQNIDITYLQVDDRIIEETYNFYKSNLLWPFMKQYDNFINKKEFMGMYSINCKEPFLKSLKKLFDNSINVKDKDVYSDNINYVFLDKGAKPNLIKQSNVYFKHINWFKNCFVVCDDPIYDIYFPKLSKMVATARFEKDTCIICHYNDSKLLYKNGPNQHVMDGKPCFNQHIMKCKLSQLSCVLKPERSCEMSYFN